MMMHNHDTFAQTLEGCYLVLFADDPAYALAASRTTPAALARKMTNGLAAGHASKDGAGVRQTCKTLGIPYTYAAIRAYLHANPAPQK